jgi:VIT1/CCC1 family predicted Fe2+/Mn2+ transporter
MPSTTGVNGAWSMYRQCAATSAFHKSQLEMFTRISLWLGIAGAVIGTLAQFVAPSPTSATSKVLGVIASLVVALAGLAAVQAVTGNRDKNWISCRAAAEGLKSAVYLYSASVPPFDGRDRAAALAERVDKTLKELGGIELRPGRMDKQPPGPLTVADYIRDRVDDQIEYYTRSAGKFQSKADFWRYCSLAAASLSAALGAVSAIFSLSPWAALLATLTASVTAYVKNQRYESMIGLYQTTAIRLQLLKDSWLDSGKTDSDKADRDLFIQHCEETLSVENGAWVVQWSQQVAQPPRQPRPEADAPESGTPGSKRKDDAAASSST